MTVTLVFLCDQCEVATVRKTVEDADSLTTPNGWQSVLGGGNYRHVCPECLLKRVRREQE